MSQRFPRGLTAFAAVAVTLLALGWVNSEIIQAKISGDGTGYYAPLASWLQDGDFDMRNELAHLNPYFLQAAFMTDEGRLGNPFPIGSALLWAPAIYLVQSLPGHAWLDAPLAQRQRTAHGAFAPRFARAILWSQIFWAMLTAGFLTWVLAGCYGLWPAVVAASAMVFGTPVFYYVLAEPSYGHTASFVSVCLFLGCILLDRRKRLPLVVLGVSYAFVVLSRTPDVVLGVLLLPRIIGEWHQHASQPKYRIRVLSFLILPFAGLASLQWIFWFHVYGDFVLVPPGPDIGAWWHPRVPQVLFSTWNGAFVWSPLLGLGLVGLYKLADRRLALVILLSIVLAVYLNSILLDWWGGRSFGARRLVSLTPLAMLGLAVLLRQCRGKWRIVLLAAVLLSMFWTQRLATYEFHGLLPGNPGNAADYVRYHPPGSEASKRYGHWDYLRLLREVGDAERMLSVRRRAAKYPARGTP